MANNQIKNVIENIKSNAISSEKVKVDNHSPLTFSDFIVPQKVYDDDINKPKCIENNDKVIIFTADQLPKKMAVKPTDYAILTGALLNPYDKNNRTTRVWLNFFDHYNKNNIWCTDFNGYYSESTCQETEIALQPMIDLDANKLASVWDNLRDCEIKTVCDENGNIKYRTINFGMYPKSYVGNELNSKLEKLYKESSLALQKLDKAYPSILEWDQPKDKEQFKISENPSFFYVNDGNTYVRVCTNESSIGANITMANGDTLKNETGIYNWVKLEPIVWKILNWDSLPKAINSKGTGQTGVMSLISEQAIVAGVPFQNLDVVMTEKFKLNFWCNSCVRGFLNGYDMNSDNVYAGNNANGLRIQKKSYDFSQIGFLNQAFSEIVSIKSKEDLERDKNKAIQKQKSYGVSIDETPMTTEEQLNFYFQNGISFMLHGPSGVGKSDRVKQLDENLESITLRNGILPEEIIGKTRYADGIVGNPDWYDEIVKKINKGESTEEILKELDMNIARNSGEWIAPNWYSKLVKKCAEEPNKQHALFIDEITNVKPCEQSLVFHLILNKSIGPNVGKLPDNAVVIAAGNSKEESESVYNMPEPLFRRFGAHIYLEPNIQDWLEWGSRPQKDNPSRTNIHPLVSAFVGTYGDKVFYSKYDPEDPPKYAIDPRGLEQLSNIIYANNNVIRKELISNKFGEDIATNFIAFAKNPPISATDVLLGNYTQEDLPTKFDQKYTLMLSLRNVGEDSIQGVRKFIGENLGGELLSQFDNIWVGDSAERAILINELGDENIEVDSKEEVDSIVNEVN